MDSRYSAISSVSILYILAHPPRLTSTLGKSYAHISWYTLIDGVVLLSCLSGLFMELIVSVHWYPQTQLHKCRG